jgi:hypothetical protein
VLTVVTIHIGIVVHHVVVGTPIPVMLIAMVFVAMKGISNALLTVTTIHVAFVVLNHIVVKGKFYNNLKQIKIKNIMSEVNKTKKYTLAEKTAFVKKVSNVDDKTTILAKAVSIVSAIKAKHLS